MTDTGHGSEKSSIIIHKDEFYINHLGEFGIKISEVSKIQIYS